MYILYAALGGDELYFQLRPFFSHCGPCYQHSIILGHEGVITHHSYPSTHAMLRGGANLVINERSRVRIFLSTNRVMGEIMA